MRHSKHGLTVRLRLDDTEARGPVLNDFSDFSEFSNIISDQVVGSALGEQDSVKANPSPILDTPSDHVDPKVLMGGERPSSPPMG